MKTILTGLAFALAATTALAESPEPPVPAVAGSTSQLTRDHVRQQVLAARHAGTLLRAGEVGQLVQPFVSHKTREQVRSEVLQGRHATPLANGYQPA